MSSLTSCPSQAYKIKFTKTQTEKTPYTPKYYQPYKKNEIRLFLIFTSEKTNFYKLNKDKNLEVA